MSVFPVPWESHPWIVPVLSSCPTLRSPLEARSSRWNLSRCDFLSIDILSACSYFVHPYSILVAQPSHVSTYHVVAVSELDSPLWFCSTFWRLVKDLLLSASVDSQLWISHLLVVPSGNQYSISKLLILSLNDALIFEPNVWGYMQLQDLGWCFHGSLPYRLWLRQPEGRLRPVCLRTDDWVPRPEVNACAGRDTLSLFYLCIYPAGGVCIYATCLVSRLWSLEITPVCFNLAWIFLDVSAILLRHLVLKSPW